MGEWARIDVWVLKNPVHPTAERLVYLWRNAQHLNWMTCVWRTVERGCYRGWSLITRWIPSLDSVQPRPASSVLWLCLSERRLRSHRHDRRSTSDVVARSLSESAVDGQSVLHPGIRVRISASRKRVIWHQTVCFTETLYKNHNHHQSSILMYNSVWWKRFSICKSFSRYFDLDGK